MRIVNKEQRGSGSTVAVYEDGSWTVMYPTGVVYAWRSGNCMYCATRLKGGGWYAGALLPGRVPMEGLERYPCRIAAIVAWRLGR